jgi:predicted methyltransferase
MSKKRLIIGLIGLSMLSSHAAQQPSIKEQIQQAMQLSDRSESDIKRDNNRQPARAMEFIGLKSNMKVIEFNPGNYFWYTKLLAPVLEDDGELIVAGNNEWMQEWLAELDNARMNNVTRTHIDMDWSNEKREFIMDNVDFKTTDADMLLNIREYHNLPDADRLDFNRAVYKALKPGGSYVVIDHTRRHMKENSLEVFRREDPIRVIKEIQEAGFVFSKYSDMFYRPDDNLNFEVSRKTVSGNSDRFFFVFTKPQ